MKNYSILVPLLALSAIANAQAISGLPSPTTPTSCTVSAGSQLCLTDGTYHASNRGGVTTTTVGTTGAGTSVVVSSASTWTPNEGIYIAGAGAAGAKYIGTVTAISGTTFTISPGTSTSVAAGALVQHDESAAINAAVTYLGSNGGGNIWLNDGVYNLNGPLQDTGGANAIVPMPQVLYDSGIVPMLSIGIRGFNRIANFASSSTPGGSVIIQSLQSNSGNVFGAYYNAGPLPNFTNVLVDMENVHIRVQANPSITAANFFWASGVYLDNDYFETAADGSSPLPTSGSGSGLILPALGNSSFVTANDILATGYATCVHAYEHTTSNRIYEANCINGLVPDSGSAYAGNGIQIDHLWCQTCTNELAAGSNKATINIDDMDLENTTSHGVNDPTNLIFGTIKFNVQASSGAITPTNPAVNGASNLCITNLQFPNGTTYGGACPVAGGVSSFNTRTGAVAPTSGDYSVAQVTGAAPIASPTLTGTPAAPTASGGTSTTQLATTAFVQAAVAAAASGAGIVTYSGPSLTLSGTQYLPIGGGGLASTTEANVDLDSPAAATAQNFSVQMSAAPGVGNTVVYTWRKNGSGTALTCTISGASATSCSDTTHSFSVVAADLMSIQAVTTGTIVGTPTIVMGTQFGIAASSGVSSVAATSPITTTGATGAITLACPTCTAGPIFFPYTFTGEITGTSTTTPSVSVTTGQLLVVACRFGTGSTGVATDSASNTYTPVTAQVGTNAAIQISWAIASTTASVTFTCTQSGSAGGLSISAYRFGGMGTTANTSTGGTASSSSSFQSPAFTTTQRTLNIFCVAIASGSGGFVPGVILGAPASLIGQGNASLSGSTSHGCEANVVTYGVQGAATMTYPGASATTAYSVLAFNY